MILASQGSSGTIEVYQNNGSGAFTKLDQSFPQAQPFSGGRFEDISLGIIFSDVNNDGYLDIVTADAWDGVNIYQNNRNGNFLASQLGLGGTEGIEVKGVDLGDIDNDGDLDMVFGGHQYFADNEVWINDGNGIFTDTGQRHYSEAIWHLALGDIDNDGDLDYVWTSRYSEPYTTSEVYLNGGDGNFSNSNQSFLPNGNSFGIVLRDVDNDGDLDFIEPNDGGGIPTEPRVRIFMNNGLGAFKDSGQNLGGSSAKDADLGDIDNDGNSDMIIATWLVENSLLINDGNGNFTQVGPDLLLPLGTHACKLGDLDNDGDLDLVTGGLIDEVYTVYYSNQASVVKNTPPSPPTTFKVENDNGKLILIWDGAADTETKQTALTYNLRIGKANNPNAIVTGSLHHGPGNMGHAQEKILRSSKEGDYIWSVQTVDTGHARSDWSEEQSLKINTPTSPNGLQASFISNSEIDLTWIDNSLIETNFSIERKNGISQSFREISTVGVDITNYTDTGLSESTTYYYRVKAFNQFGNSAYSNEVKVESISESSANAERDRGDGGCFIAELISKF